jgi:hypothetical protein
MIRKVNGKARHAMIWNGMEKGNTSEGKAWKVEARKVKEKNSMEWHGMA